MGGFLRNPPQLAHTGTGQLTITNYRPTAQYAVFTGTGDVQANTSVVDGVVNLNDVYGTYSVGYAASKGNRATSFSRLRITYHTENQQTCSDNCGVVNGTNCYEGTGTCWCGSCAADGTICCGGCYGQSCSGNPNAQVKDPVPAGYTERYGEWVKIDNPVETTEAKDTGLFTLPQVQWDDDYYASVAMPAPYEASEYGEDGKPTGNTIPGRPAWDYKYVYFIHYDTEGEVVWTRDNQTNPECFTVVEIEKMKTYEMLVKHLPAAYAGTYEFVIADDDKEYVREEGNV